jgi:hypothetical protein
MQYMNKLRRMNYSFEMPDENEDEEDYIVPSKEEIMLQWFHELESMDKEEYRQELEEITS